MAKLLRKGKETADIEVRLQAMYPRQAELLAHPARFKVAMLGRRTGKALALDTPLPTPDGWTTMGDVAVGDRLYDEHGRICRVTFATEIQYDRPCFRVVFSDGTTVVADAEHRWLTWDKRARKNAARNALRDTESPPARAWPPRKRVEPAVRTTEEIRSTLMCGKETNHAIPCAGPVEGVSPDWTVHPYALGAWLGDGSSTGGMMWSNDPEIIDELRRLGEPVLQAKDPYGWRMTDGVQRNPYDPSRRQVFTARLRALGVIGNKHIPAAYLRASAEDRLALLQGLMDTDGHVSKQGDCEFCSVSATLAEGVLDLCLGLGIRAVMRVDNAKLNGRVVSKRYRVCFTTDVPVFRLPRKAERLATRPGRGSGRVVTQRLIVAVEPVESVPVRCITVDSPSHLFLCTRAYIPTHNTVSGIRWLSDGALAGEPVAWFAPGYKYAAEVWRELVMRLGPVVASKNEQEKRLELLTGGVIDIWTLDGDDPARGRKYARVVVDEAGIVPDLLPKWQEAIRPTLTDLAGRAMFLGTPKGRRHGFVQLFQRGERGDDPDWASFRFATMENPYIPPGEIEAARRELPPEIFRQEYEAVPTDDGANPFGLEAIRAAVAPLSDQLPVVYGLDVARAMDWTVLVGLDAWQRVCYLDRWQAPWAVTKDKVRRVVGGTPVVGDATGVGDAIVADLQAMGVSVSPYIFTAPSKLRLMQRLIAAFQGQTIKIPGGWLQGELESFEFTYTASGVKYEAPPGLHDDGVMALSLALYGWDRVQGVAPETTPDLPMLVPDDPMVQEGRSASLLAGAFQGQLPDGF